LAEDIVALARRILADKAAETFVMAMSHRAIKVASTSWLSVMITVDRVRGGIALVQTDAAVLATQSPALGTIIAVLTAHDVAQSDRTVLPHPNPETNNHQKENTQRHGDSDLDTHVITNLIARRRCRQVSSRGVGDRHVNATRVELVLVAGREASLGQDGVIEGIVSIQPVVLDFDRIETLLIVEVRGLVNRHPRVVAILDHNRDGCVGLEKILVPDDVVLLVNVEV
jgi:hypothetical protein